MHCRGENNVYECTICNVFVTSHEQFTTHIEGIKHQTKLRQVEGKECALKPLAHRKSRGTLRGRVAHGSGRGGMQLDRGACILSLSKFFPHENAVYTLNQKVHTVTAVIFFRDCRYLGRWYPGKVMCCAYFFLIFAFLFLVFNHFCLHFQWELEKRGCLTLHLGKNKKDNKCFLKEKQELGMASGTGGELVALEETKPEAEALQSQAAWALSQWKLHIEEGVWTSFQKLIS